MNKIKNIIAVIALSASFAIAGDGDGHTGSGNRCETCPPCTENCTSGYAEQDPEAVTGMEETGGETSLIESWTEMFFELIG